MKPIILTFDYELFFGTDSGTVKQTLIIPTNYILNSLDKYGLKGTFFIDWQMLKFIQEVNDERSQNDYLLIEKQLQDIVSRGHRIELHIHPHWVDAKYIGNGRWDYSDFDHYSLYSFSTEEVTQMFEEGADKINSIARKVDTDYRVIAFRAGGWTVQPFDKLMLGFKKTGISIDSSVAIGAYRESPFYKYDFREVKTNNKSFYHFNNDVTIEDSCGEFVEVPISTFHRGILYKALDKFFRVLFKKYAIPIADGTHKRQDLPPAPKSTRAMVTMSTMNPLSVILSVICQSDEIVTLIDHPKDYSHSVKLCLWMISKFCKSITYLNL